MIISDFSTFASGANVGGTGTGTRTIGSGLAVTQLLADGTDDAAGDIGAGEQLYFVVTMASDLSGAGNITIRLVTDDASNLAQAQLVLASRPYGSLAAVQGAILMCVPLPQEGTEYKKYIGLQVERSGDISTSAGESEVNAFLTRQPPKHYSYADGAPALA